MGLVHLSVSAISSPRLTNHPIPKCLNAPNHSIQMFASVPCMPGRSFPTRTSLGKEGQALRQLSPYIPTL